MAMDFRLQSEELEFARRHIQNFYSSDFFPDVPEFDAVWAAWDEVRDYLENRSVENLGQPPLIMAVPKSGGGYRVVHQLHPLDALVYTALARKVAPELEERRSPAEEGIVCSYRINITPNGHFFSENRDGYSTFHENSSILADEKRYVLSLDIAGFYNHIYIYRVQSSIELCHSGFRDLSMAIEEFLLNLNQRISVGIPIGPAASIIFAEAVLLDVDEFIRTQAKGSIQYVRYVDDFRLFSDSRCDLEEIHHELTSYLYRAHRLTLGAGKSRLIESDRFKDDVLQPPEEAEQRALETKVAEFMEGFDEGDYGSWESEAEEVTWDSAPDEAKREAIKALFQEVLSAPTLDIGLARHILRRSRCARVRAILPDVLKNISFLAPVIRDVGLYLEKVLSAKAIEKSMRRFERVVSSDVTEVPLVRYWLCSLFATRNEFAMSSAIRDFVLGSPIDVRSQAIFAKTNGQLSWVKKKKDDWRNLGLWDRTALLMAGEVLASRERSVWMGRGG